MNTKYTCKLFVHNNFQNYYKLIRNLSIIRQKGESQNGGNKRTKYAKFSGKTNISYPLIRTRYEVNYRSP